MSENTPVPACVESPRLTDILARGRNNFDLIRLVAALAVIFGHSFYLFPTGGFREPVTILINRNFAGTLAVGVFFFISGMLICQSFQRSDAPFRFAIMRVARIYPGAIVCLLVTVYVIGAIATKLPLGEYLLSAEAACYVRDNWSFFAPNAVCHTLPGVFSTNRLGPYPNGSLWTLQPEIICYAYVLVFGCLRCLKSPARICLVLLGLLLLHVIAPAWVPYFSDSVYSDKLKVGLFFMAGVGAFALQEFLPIRIRYAFLLSALAATLQNTSVEEYALYAALFYWILVAATSPSLQRVKLPGDYSFGVYIYGFPVQQIVNQFMPELTSYPSNLLCLPIALAAGYLSWNLVERPALERAQMLVEGKRARFDSFLRKSALLPVYLKAKLRREP